LKRKRDLDGEVARADLKEAAALLEFIGVSRSEPNCELSGELHPLPTSHAVARRSDVDDSVAPERGTRCKWLRTPMFAS
jgi:hypothetical protein